MRILARPRTAARASGLTISHSLHYSLTPLFSAAGAGAAGLPVHVGSEGSLRIHTQGEGDRSPRPKYACSTAKCPYSTDRKDRMDRHAALHAAAARGEGVPFQCDACAFLTGLSSVLKAHRRFEHDLEPDPLPSSADGKFATGCGAMLGCAFTSSDPQRLRDHEEQHSEDALSCDVAERRFLCEWPACGFSAVFKGELQTHWIKHDWRCECGSRFEHPLTGSALDKHLRTGKHQDFLRAEGGGRAGEGGGAGATSRVDKVRAAHEPAPLLSTARAAPTEALRGANVFVDGGAEAHRRCLLCSKSVSNSRTFCTECTSGGLKWSARYYSHLAEGNGIVKCPRCPALFKHSMAVKSHCSQMPDCASKVPIILKHFPDAARVTRRALGSQSSGSAGRAAAASPALSTPDKGKASRSREDDVDGGAALSSRPPKRPSPAVDADVVASRDKCEHWPSSTFPPHLITDLLIPLSLHN